MRLARLVIDTNLLILLIVGATDRRYISAHKRTKKYLESDFDLLLSIIQKFDEVVLTPNTLSETSNLLPGIAEPAKTSVATTFIRMVSSLKEDYQESKLLVKHPAFVRLGLADCALMTLGQMGDVVLTDDFPLYREALEKGVSAYNFTHERQSTLLSS